MLSSILKTATRPVNPALPIKLLTLGDHLRKRRIDLSLNQKRVAKILNVTEATVWNWENNRSEPQTKHYPIITKFLGYCIYCYPKRWGEILKLCRTHKGYSRRDLAKFLSVDPASIRRWEERNTPPWEKMVVKIENLFCIHF